jgi:hypothetical protein
VGKNRIHPRELRRGLAELSNNRRPRRGQIGDPGPWEPVTGIYASADMSFEEARDSASLLLEDVERFRSLNRIEVLDRLRAVLEQSTRIFVRSETSPDASTNEGRSGTGCAFVDTHDLVSRTHGVAMWVTHETEWLYPDNPHLWQFLSRCLQRGIRPLIVARKIHQTAFTLFESLDLRGVQYFSTLVPEEDHEDLSAIRDRIGWIHLRRVEEIADHSVIEQIDSSARYLKSNPMSPTVHEALQVATRLGLGATAGPQALLSWVRESDTKFPKWWMTAIRRWEAWDAYRVPRRPGLPSAAVSGRRDNPIPEGSGRSRRPNPSSQQVSPPPESTDCATEHRTFGRETKITRVPLRLR